MKRFQDRTTECFSDRSLEEFLNDSTCLVTWYGKIESTGTEKNMIAIVKITILLSSKVTEERRTDKHRISF